jgi:prepilin-type processing-associated H-X9-DG protein
MSQKTLSRSNVFVIALILVAATSLVLAGINKARGSHLRQKCRMNLNLCFNELAWCFQDSRYAGFPEGTYPNEGLSPERRLSWFVTSLAYLRAGEKGSVAIPNWFKAWDSDENRRIAALVVNELHCPAQPEPGDSAAEAFGLTHYVGIAGIGERAAELQQSDSNAGVFGYERQTKLTDIKDGTANTMFLVETGNRHGPWGAGGFPTVRGLKSTGQAYIGLNCQFGGLHNGGCMALFADGAIHFLKDSISPAVFEAFSTIAGNEAVTPPSDD